MGRFRGHTCVFPPLQEEVGAAASVVPARRSSANRHTGRAPPRVERGARDPTACAAQARDTLARSASWLPERPGLWRRATAAQVRGSEAAEPRPGSGGARPSSGSQVAAGRRGMRYGRPQHAFRSQVTGRAPGRREDSWVGEGSLPEGGTPPPQGRQIGAEEMEGLRSLLHRGLRLEAPKEWLRQSG